MHDLVITHSDTGYAQRSNQLKRGKQDTSDVAFSLTMKTPSVTERPESLQLTFIFPSASL